MAAELTVTLDITSKRFRRPGHSWVGSRGGSLAVFHARYITTTEYIRETTPCEHSNNNNRERASER